MFAMKHHIFHDEISSSLTIKCFPLNKLTIAFDFKSIGYFYTNDNK